MSNEVKGLRGTSSKSMQVFQIQFVGLLLVLLVILGSKLTASDKPEKQYVEKEFGIATVPTLARVEIGIIEDGRALLNSEKLDSVRYLLNHHDINAKFEIAVSEENFSVGERILTILEKEGLPAGSYNVVFNPKQLQNAISVVWENSKMESVL